MPRKVSKAPFSHAVTRRDVIRGIGAAGVGAAAAGPLARGVSAQAKAPVTLTFWTWENPQQRPWQHKRIKLFMEQNPNVKVNFEWFTFGDLGKKLSVGFATGTAPDGFASQDWYMPTWMAKDLLAPLDIQRLGYSSLDAFKGDFARAFAEGAIKDGKVYGYPMWFYGFCNYVNTNHFKEAGLDPEKDVRDWESFGEAARRLTRKEGDKFVRQGFKFAMHAAQWTMIQFNPILIQCGGAWFDANGKCTVNNEAGVKAMTLRASLARQYGAEDPAESIATNPLPQMDWLKERASMFWCHPIPLQAIASQNQKMLNEGYYQPVQYPGVEKGKEGISTTYGFNLVVNSRAPKEKQEVLHDMYRFMMADLVDCWKETAPLTLARKTGWVEDPSVKNFPHVDAVLRAKDQGVYLPRTVVYNELADAMHRGVQKVMLSKADIKATLDEIAAEVDRATEAYKKG
jgi:multiple sugar transport system substrate-binding protein